MSAEPQTLEEARVALMEALDWYDPHEDHDVPVISWSVLLRQVHVAVAKVDQVRTVIGD